MIGVGTDWLCTRDAGKQTPTQAHLVYQMAIRATGNQDQEKYLSIPVKRFSPFSMMGLLWDNKNGKSKKRDGHTSISQAPSCAALEWWRESVLRSDPLTSVLCHFSVLHTRRGVFLISRSCTSLQEKDGPGVTGTTWPVDPEKGFGAHIHLD